MELIGMAKEICKGRVFYRVQGHAPVFSVPMDLEEAMDEILAEMYLENHGRLALVEMLYDPARMEGMVVALSSRLNLKVCRAMIRHREEISEQKREVKDWMAFERFCERAAGAISKGAA